MAHLAGQNDDRRVLAGLADEQEALRRVATLVAKGVPSGDLFAAVTTEAAHVFADVDPELVATVIRFDPGPECVLVGESREYEQEPLGARWAPRDLYVSARVLRTGSSARVDESDLDEVGGPFADVLRLRGFLYQVGSPVVVEGQLWGAMTLNSGRELSPDTDERLESFTELVATAIANAESREAIAELASEQAALRRVATLVARDAPSTEVFEAVATEVGKLLDTEITVVGRYDGDGAATAIGSWSASGGGVPVGTTSAIGGRNVLTFVAETGKPARMDGYDEASGEAADIARRFGWRSSIAAPIVVEGRLWGVMLVATQRAEPFPAGAEERLAAFTDLVATAVANTEARHAVERVAAEQAALRRVATLVAQGASPQDLFDAVAEEVGRLLPAANVSMGPLRSRRHRHLDGLVERRRAYVSSRRTVADQGHECRVDGAPDGQAGSCRRLFRGHRPDRRRRAGGRLHIRRWKPDRRRRSPLGRHLGCLDRGADVARHRGAPRVVHGSGRDSARERGGAR
jgi:GAF domain-containing protein